MASGIHIKPSHKGLLHKSLGIGMNKVEQMTFLQIWNPSAFFAQTLSLLVGSDGVNPVSGSNPLPISGTITTSPSVTAAPSATFNRPANTTPYAAGDLVANNVTAGSVAAMDFTVGQASPHTGSIFRCRVKKNSTTVTDAEFRLHLWSTAPTVTNGDNGVFLPNNYANYLGYMDVVMDVPFSDGAAAIGLPYLGEEMLFTTLHVYGLLESKGPGGYIPTSGETFVVELEVKQN